MYSVDNYLHDFYLSEWLEPSDCSPRPGSLGVVARGVIERTQSGSRSNPFEPS